MAHVTQANWLTASVVSGRIEIRRGSSGTPVLTQHAEPGTRPFIHPIHAPDGDGVLTENAPPHHRWQHGLYVGLNDVNGVGFWTEGLAGNPNDGTFHPEPLKAPEFGADGVRWNVVSHWRSPAGETMLTETQQWRLQHLNDTLVLDLEWALHARINLTFGKYAYGGLFLRMPYRKERGGTALNSDGLGAPEAEGKRARWVAISIPIDSTAGGTRLASMAILDHPKNPEHPVPFRVDGDFGIAPSRCIAGAWKLDRGERVTYQHRVLASGGAIDRQKIEAYFESFSDCTKL
jgi:hypothetical protein